jgi:hypothetical protein|tara:strand:- start:23 stop:247 length:225 start_codon:yes stop_codon:yes gene_type:complete
MEMEPKTEREHIISIQGHITGVKRDLNNLKSDVSHLHRDIETLGGKIDKIYWVVLTTVGAVGLIFIEGLLGMVT